VALGGGVVGDLAGFAAASFPRGIDFAQVPARGGVSKSLEGGKKYAGAYPITELGEHLKTQAKLLRIAKKS